MPPPVRAHVEQRHGFREALFEKEPLGVTPTALHKLPTLDEVRTFCLSPTTAVERMRSDLDRLSVAYSSCIAGSILPVGCHRPTLRPATARAEALATTRPPAWPALPAAARPWSPAARAAPRITPFLMLGGLEGEPKQVTVPFVGLKDAMEPLAHRAPEEARRLLDPGLERMVAAVYPSTGTANPCAGDSAGGV
jgi:hypothetical protein